MTRLTYAFLLAFAVCVGAATAANAQNCTTSEFMGTTTTRCTDGTNAVGTTFMGTQTTRIQTPNGDTKTCTTGALWLALMQPTEELFARESFTEATLHASFAAAFSP